MRFHFHKVDICVNGAGDVEIAQESGDQERGPDLVHLSRYQLGVVIDALTQLKDSKEDWHIPEDRPKL